MYANIKQLFCSILALGYKCTVFVKKNDCKQFFTCIVHEVVKTARCSRFTYFPQFFKINWKNTNTWNKNYYGVIIFSLLLLLTYK